MNPWDITFTAMLISLGFAFTALLLVWAVNIGYDTWIRWQSR